MGAGGYPRLVEGRVRPMYEELKHRCAEERLARPMVAYGYFRSFSEGDTLVVQHGGRDFSFPFPRQKNPPHLCIGDYFRKAAEGGDVAGFFVATIGGRLGAAGKEMTAAHR